MQKINYDKKMQEEIKSLDKDKKPKLLLHACCGPCSTYPIEELKDIFDITIDFYNPNIENEEEFNKRLEELKSFIKDKNIGLEYREYDHNEFLKVAEGLEEEKEGGKRCLKCFKLRLTEAAKRAKDENFDYFTTSLSISPLKNSAVLNTLGEKIGREEDIKYLLSDFKKRNGYKRSVELSKKYNLYRQDYCGCEFSKRDREN